MLTIAKGKANPVTVALDACGSNVMLSIQDIDGIRFRQALDACDVGAVLEACDKVHRKSEYNTIVCEGDLAVNSSYDGLTLKWPGDGVFGVVHVPIEGMLVFEEALRSYCRLLMRSPEDTP